MAQAAEKILSTLAPHLRTVGVALRGAGASLMAYAPPAAADVGAQLEANGARPSVAAGAFVVPTSVESICPGRRVDGVEKRREI